MNSFDKKLGDYLAVAEEDRDIVVGANLLLQLNNNPILHRNILQRPERFKAKLWYELDKYARIRAVSSTTKIVENLAPKAIAIDVNAPAKGKRADHDLLPDNIQQLYVDNLPLLQSMRSTHEKLKQATRDCDRAELAAVLLEQDDRYRANWLAYDSYIVGTAPAVPTVVEEKEVDGKAINAARTYLSKNKSKLALLKADESAQDKYVELLNKMQDRVNLLLSAEAEFTAELKLELVDLGLVFS